MPPPARSRVGNPGRAARVVNGRTMTGPRPTTTSWVDVVVWTARLLVVTATTGTVVFLVLIQRFGHTYSDALDVTRESALLLADAEGPVPVIAEDLEQLALVVVDTLDRTQALLGTGADTVDDVGGAAATNLAETAEGVAAIADRIAGVIETIERFIPGDTQSAAEELRTIADGLEPTADQLRGLGTQLETAASQLDDAEAVVADLGAEIQTIADDIGALQPSLDQLAQTAEDLEERAADASDRLGLDLWLARALVILGGTALVAIGVISERLVKAFVAQSDGVLAPGAPGPGTGAPAGAD